MLRQLRRHGFPGPVYAVGRSASIGEGGQGYAGLRSLPEVPEQVILAVPADRVLAAVRDCAQAGVPAVTVYSGGLGERGDAGQRVEREIGAIARGAGMSVCGPNCQGVSNVFDRFVGNFSTVFSGSDLAPGPVAVLSQSGLVGGLLYRECARRGLHAGFLVSTGNESEFTVADAIDYLAADARVKVMVCYLEELRAADVFAGAVRRAQDAGQSIAALKIGRSAEGARLAQSHTGALAGEHRLYDAYLRELGVHRCDELEELADIASALAAGRRSGPESRVAIVTNSGGLGIMCVDALRARGLSLANFGEDTAAAVASVLPGHGRSENPVDVGALSVSDPAAVRAVIDRVCADAGVGALLACMGGLGESARVIADGIVAAAGARGLPTVAVWSHSDAACAGSLRRAGVVCVDEPARGVRALSALLQTTRREGSSASGAPVPGAVAGALSGLPPGVVGEGDALAALAKAGVRVPRWIRVRTDAEVAAAAARIGFPVVVKVDAPGMPHKSDFGGVELDLRSPEAAVAAARLVKQNAMHRSPGIAIRGVIVAEMVRGGVEMLIGLRRDRRLGLFVVLGFGGVTVELLRDVAVRRAPVSPGEAREMVADLAGAALLRAGRWGPDRDIEALCALVARISALGAHAGELEELDLNPVMVLEAGRGVVVVDALARIGATQ